MDCESRRRNITGLLILDKRSGISSNAALQEVKRLYGAAKVGHTGSLDPLATGVLPLCFGRATKFSSLLFEADKTYLAEIGFGLRTDSGDADGRIIARRLTNGLARSDVEAAMMHFCGEIEQIPPMYSACKYRGQRLYSLARQGIEVERSPRRVTVHKLSLTAFKEQWCWLEIRCGKGVYIRAIADELGEILGCGAYLKALRRLAVGAFSIDTAVTFAKLEQIRRTAGIAGLDALPISLHTLLADYPELRLPADAIEGLRHGRTVTSPEPLACGWVRIMAGNDAQGGFAGVGMVRDDGRIVSKCMMC